MEFLEKFKNLSTPILLATGISLVGIIGLLDYLSGYEFSFSLFYLFPIFFVTWFLSKRYGTAIAILSAVTWLAADLSAGRVYSHPFFPFWSMLVRFGFFITVVFLLAALHRSLDHEKELARTDSLTGAANSRQFEHVMDMEIKRSHRYGHSFTVVYLDADNFKHVNDRFGHKEGDRVLTAIAHHTMAYLRKTDTLARLGGDEFAILLPETNEEGARAVIAKVRDGLMEQMRLNNWPITFSIGVLSCLDSSCDPDRLISVVDRLMYSVKQNGKNSAAYLTINNNAVVEPSDDIYSWITLLQKMQGEK